MNVYLPGILVALAIIITMVELLRRRRLSEKYALWMLVSATVTVLAVAPGLLDSASKLAHIKTPSNLLFFLGIVTLLLVCVHLSCESHRLEEETRTLAEEVSLLRLRLEQQLDGSGR